MKKDVLTDILKIDHEYTWDQMFGRFLPPDANPFRKQQASVNKGVAEGGRSPVIGERSTNENQKASKKSAAKS